MVTHESYRDEEGNWLYPSEVERQPDGTVTVAATGKTVIVGRSEAMSKSRRNTVDPGSIVERYGADTARWFVLSDNPPERDVEWSEAGVAGAHRFVQRLYRLAAASPEAAEEPEGFAPEAVSLRRATHRTIAAVTEAIENFGFNTAVARVYELVNALAEADRLPADTPGLASAKRECALALVRLVAPMMPHLAEEIAARIDPAGGLVALRPWPEADPALVAREVVTIAVQIMGKLRGTIEAEPGAPAEDVIGRAEAEPNVARQLAGKRIVKRVHVPDRIVNFVVAP